MDRMKMRSPKATSLVPPILGRDPNPPPLISSTLDPLAKNPTHPRPSSSKKTEHKNHGNNGNVDRSASGPRTLTTDSLEKKSLKGDATLCDDDDKTVMKNTLTKSPVPRIRSAKMDSVSKLDSSSPVMNQKEKHQHHHRHHHRKPNPILHPDVAHAQCEEVSRFRFSEEARPMFSPIPRNLSSDGEDSPRPTSSRG